MEQIFDSRTRKTLAVAGAFGLSFLFLWGLMMADRLPAQAVRVTPKGRQNENSCRPNWIGPGEWIAQRVTLPQDADSIELYAVCRPDCTNDLIGYLMPEEGDEDIRVFELNATELNNYKPRKVHFEFAPGLNPGNYYFVFFRTGDDVKHIGLLMADPEGDWNTCGPLWQGGRAGMRDWPETSLWALTIYSRISFCELIQRISQYSEFKGVWLVALMAAFAVSLGAFVVYWIARARAARFCLAAAVLIAGGLTFYTLSTDDVVMPCSAEAVTIQEEMKEQVRAIVDRLKQEEWSKAAERHP